MTDDTDIIIRKAVFSDATAIAGVQTDTWKVSYKNLVPEEILAQKTVSPEKIAQFEKCINEERVWVAEKNGGIDLEYLRKKKQHAEII